MKNIIFGIIDGIVTFFMIVGFLLLIFVIIPGLIVFGAKIFDWWFSVIF